METVQVSCFLHLPDETAPGGARLVELLPEGRPHPDVRSLADHLLGPERSRVRAELLRHVRRLLDVHARLE